MEKRNALLEMIHMISWQSHAKRQLEETVFFFNFYFIFFLATLFVWILFHSSSGCYLVTLQDILF